jgi:hypothetical protein
MELLPNAGLIALIILSIIFGGENYEKGLIILLFASLGVPFSIYCINHRIWLIACYTAAIGRRRVNP